MRGVDYYESPMVTAKLKELEASRAKLASLEKEIASQLQSELAGLPAQYGFESVEIFVKAVRVAAGGKSGGVTRNPVSGKKRRKRSVITDAMRNEVKKLVEAGKTGAEIAAAVDISLPSVQNIKKSLGLVRER
jgi:hypothetical protein